MPFKKGYIPWNKGKKLQPLSKETKMKMREKHLGRKNTKKHNENISKAKKGIKLSDKHKKALSRNHADFSGKNGPGWKGGITPKNTRIRNSIEFRLWREAVFARDNWTCQKTGIKGGKLNAHHIKNFVQCSDLRLAIDNGITLSEKAHKKFHKKYGRKNNTKGQIIDFLNIINDIS